jgi:purine nucleosidase
MNFLFLGGTRFGRASLAADRAAELPQRWQAPHVPTRMIEGRLWDHTMDWNSQIDVESTHFVLQHSNPTLVPLPVTIETSLRRAYLRDLRQAGPLARLIAAQAEVWAEDEQIDVKYGQTCDDLPDDTINFLHNPLTCAIALGWKDSVEISDVPLAIEIQDGWLRPRVNPAGKPTLVVTRVDASKFGDLWRQLVTA